MEEGSAEPIRRRGRIQNGSTQPSPCAQRSGLLRIPLRTALSHREREPNPAFSAPTLLSHKGSALQRPHFIPLPCSALRMPPHRPWVAKRKGGAASDSKSHAHCFRSTIQRHCTPVALFFLIRSANPARTRRPALSSRKRRRRYPGRGGQSTSKGPGRRSGPTAGKQPPVVRLSPVAVGREIVAHVPSRLSASLRPG